MTDPNFPSSLFDSVPFGEKNSPFWPASAFTLRRNLSRHQFPNKQSEQSAKQVLEEITKTLMALPCLKNPTFYDFSLLEPSKRTLLFEHYFVPDGVYEERPYQGLITDESGLFLAGINLSDHLVFQLIDCKNKWHESWSLLQEIESSLCKKLDFAFSSKLGYLTSNVYLCGTGLTLRLYLHLPALLHVDQKKENTQLEKHDDCIVTQMGDDTDLGATFLGDLIILQNKRCLGVSEDLTLQALYNFASSLIQKENESRDAIKNGNYPYMKDLVGKAYGILMHSYQMSMQDALAALSLVKLGVDLNWIQGVSDFVINKTFFQCRRGHLELKQKEPSSADDLLHVRAEFIRNSLKEAKLII